MNKILKTTLISLGAIIFLIIGFVAIVNMRGIPTYEPGKVELTVSLDSASIENGRYIANAICIHCHRDPETNRLTGRALPEAPELGAVFSKNITQHPEKGIGSWSDGELKYYLRTGIKRDGTFGLPPMIRLPNMSDEDVDDLIAFLRSDNSIVAASEVEAPESEPSFLLTALSQFVLAPLPYPREEIASPDRSDLVALGEYLVNDRLLCYACHSENIQMIDELEPVKSPGYLGGGNPMFTDGNIPINTANITMDPKTGIGKWTKEEFKTAIRAGRKPQGGMINTPMIPYPNLSDKELDAIYIYLQTVPNIENMVVRNN